MCRAQRSCAIPLIGAAGDQLRGELARDGLHTESRHAGFANSQTTQDDVEHVVDESGNDLPVGETGILAFEAPEGYGVKYHQDQDSNPHLTSAALPLG